MSVYRILTVRNDRLGDFLLAWPSFALLKAHAADCVLATLVPEYTKPAADLCPWLDEVISYRDTAYLGPAIASSQFDALIALYSSLPVATAAWRASIPYRLAPATKWWQFLFNRRLAQRRSRSEKPEYAYNLDLCYRYLYDQGLIDSIVTTEDDGRGDFLPSAIKRPLLQLPAAALTSANDSLSALAEYAKHGKRIIIHPGSGGSANNLSIQQYAALIQLIDQQLSGPRCYLISSGPGEEATGKHLCSLLADIPAFTTPTRDLATLAGYISLADLFISNSTGPYHLAGLLNRPTATLFPRHRSGSALRWQSLNEPSKRLVFTPPDSADSRDVASIDLNATAATISDYLLK